jgi:hypothetical protein
MEDTHQRVSLTQLKVVEALGFTCNTRVVQGTQGYATLFPDRQLVLWELFTGRG